MLGAENRGAVTCYLDSLLFAMFAKLESFECMLKNDLPDEPPRKLAALLRLWVNMLRSGKLIEADMTQHIQDALAACGWKDAQQLEQQDTSEAFAFITETLQLPLLTLQVDLFHQGKNDDADHKVVYERLLNLAVPSETEGKGIRLEDCLEEYFNSQVDVLRDSLDEKKTGDRSDLAPTPRTPTTPSTPGNTIRVVNEVEFNRSETLEVNGLDEVLEHKRSEGHEKCTEHEGQGNHTGNRVQEGHEGNGEDLEPPHLARRWTEVPKREFLGSPSSVRPNRSRTESIIQRVVIDEKEQTSEADTASLFQRAKKKASVVKAVTIPAWQFFKLIRK
jgi:hypothetical protein